jgi:hypothetical protein
MWLAQFVCTPQFFKTPKGLCGHDINHTTGADHIEINTFIENRENYPLFAQGICVVVVLASITM